MSKLQYIRKNIELTAGKEDDVSTLIMPSGTVLGVYAVPQTDLPKELIEVSVQDSQNGNVVNPTDIRDYLHKGGNYIDGVKPIGYASDGQQFFINTKAGELPPNGRVTPLNLKFQLIFILDQED